MTPELKIKLAILQKFIAQGFKWEFDGTPEDIENAWEVADEELVHGYCLSDCIEEFRCAGTPTPGIEAESNRHYESDAVAAKMEDGSWVGWLYWHGGGKHGEPSAIEWMGDAYELAVSEEEKMVTVRTFTKA